MREYICLNVMLFQSISMQPETACMLERQREQTRRYVSRIPYWMQTDPVWFSLDEGRFPAVWT